MGYFGKPLFRPPYYTMKNPLGFRWFSPPGEMPPLLFGGKAGTVMIGLANHYTIKNPLGFPRFLRSKMTGRTLAGQEGTVMIGFANHYTTVRRDWQFFSGEK